MAENGWNEYQRLVVDKLDNHERQLEKIHKDIAEMKVTIGQLQLKSTIWGIFGGTIPILIAFIIALITGILKLS